MLIRLIGMNVREPGLKRIPQAYREGLRRSCEGQLKGCLMATGPTAERALEALCEMIVKDQLPTQMAWADLEPIEVPPLTLTLEVESLDQEIDTAGIFPDDFDARWTFLGRFFLDGRRVPADRGAGE